jgi:hypothetical protein
MVRTLARALGQLYLKAFRICRFSPETDFTIADHVLLEHAGFTIQPIHFFQPSQNPSKHAIVRELPTKLSALKPFGHDTGTDNSGNQKHAAYELRSQSGR